MSERREEQRPTPGSDAALDRGCTCPVLDNAHGAGVLGLDERYIITEDCPLHDPKEFQRG
jgi:hypothetical protein